MGVGYANAAAQFDEANIQAAHAAADVPDEDDDDSTDTELFAEIPIEKLGGES